MTRASALSCPHGRIVLVELSQSELELVPLVGDEREVAARRSPTRRREFVAGRTALRAALGLEVAIVSDERGAPVLPSGWVGSISHKGARAAALAAPAGSGHVGLDLEIAAEPRGAIERRVLTAREQAQLTSRREITLRFALKEAVYKAVDPIVRRYVAFDEVEVEPDAGGGCRVRVVDPTRLPVELEAWWCEHDGLWLATARAKSA